MLPFIFLFLSLAVSAFGQFGNTAYHIAYGPNLPATCLPSTGDVFVKNNVNPTLAYLCTATNTWTQFSGGGGGTCAGLLGDVTGPCNANTIKTSVALAGSPTTTTQSANDNTTKIATTAYVDGIGAATKAGVQAGGYLYCNSASAANTYSCTLTPTLTAYTAGMCVILNVTNANTAASTLNIDGRGAKAINTSNNVAIGAGAITALALYQVCYDGTEFLMPQDSVGAGGVTTITLSGSNSLNGKYYFQKITLSGSVTISSITNIKAGIYAFVICQNGSGNFTYAWPASVLGGMTIGLTASECNTQTFNSDGTTLYASTPGVTNE